MIQLKEENIWFWDTLVRGLNISTSIKTANKYNTISKLRIYLTNFSVRKIKLKEKHKWI